MGETLQQPEQKETKDIQVLLSRLEQKIENGEDSKILFLELVSILKMMDENTDLVYDQAKLARNKAEGLM